MSFILITFLILCGIALFGQSKREEEKLDAAIEPVEGIKHGVKAMFFTVVAGLFVILALLLLGISSLPPVK